MGKSFVSPDTRLADHEAFITMLFPGVDRGLNNFRYAR